MPWREFELFPKKNDLGDENKKNKIINGMKRMEKQRNVARRLGVAVKDERTGGALALRSWFHRSAGDNACRVREVGVDGISELVSTVSPVENENV